MKIKDTSFILLIVAITINFFCWGFVISKNYNLQLTKVSNKRDIDHYFGKCDYYLSITGAMLNNKIIIPDSVWTEAEREYVKRSSAGVIKYDPYAKSSLKTQ